MTFRGRRGINTAQVQVSLASLTQFVIVQYISDIIMSPLGRAYCIVVYLQTKILLYVSLFCSCSRRMLYHQRAPLALAAACLFLVYFIYHSGSGPNSYNDDDGGGLKAGGGGGRGSNHNHNSNRAAASQTRTNR